MADDSGLGSSSLEERSITVHDAELVRPEAREPEPAPPKKPRGPWATVTALAALALSKLKLLFLGLKALPFAKLLLTSGTMFVSILVYAWHGGIQFAVGFVLMLLIHELGHGVAIKRYGLAAGFPVFIPFFGAVISLKGQPRTPLVEAEIAIAGPVAGAGAALVACVLYFLSHNQLFLVLAHVGFLLNLFNLTPFGFLDGGRIAKLFSRNAWIAGAVILAGVYVVTHAPQLILIALMSLPHVLRRTGPAPGAEEVTRSERVNMAFHYFGLCAFLAAGMYLSGRLIEPS
jgi:Zn-dependent protease